MKLRRAEPIIASALALGLHLMASQNQLYAQNVSGAINRSAFASPPDTMRPSIRWWWPGGAVDDNEPARELAAMRNAGFRGQKFSRLR